MIIRNNKTASALYKGTKEIIKRYKGTLIVYESWKNLIASGVPPLTLTKCKGMSFKYHKLPNEYQQVEYIESNKKQYIDIGYVPKQNDKYKLKLEFPDLSGNQVVFGSRSSGTYQTSLDQVYLNKSTSTNLVDYLLFFSGTTQNKLFLSETNKVYDLELNISDGTFNNTATQNLCMFALNNMGNVTAYASMKLYDFKIYNNDELKVHLIPCYRKSDNVIGLYNLVDNKFYTNQGTGEFSKGKDIEGFLIDYKIYGNSVQEGENLFDINLVGAVYISDTVARIGQEFTFDVNKTLIISREQYNGNQYYKIKSNGVFSGTYVILEDKTVNLTAGNTLIIYSTLKQDLVGLKVTDNTPTPETPIEIESVGDKTKNLFDKNNTTYGQGTFWSTGNGKLWSSKDYYASPKIPIKENTRYTRSNTSTSANIFWDKDGNFLSYTSSNPSTTINTPEGARYVGFNIPNSIDPSEIQLNEGTTLLEYEPYGYRIPVKVSGKNLFDINLSKNYLPMTIGSNLSMSVVDDCFLLNGSANLVTTKFIDIQSKNLKANQTYTFVMQSISGSVNTGITGPYIYSGNAVLSVDLLFRPEDKIKISKLTLTQEQIDNGINLRLRVGGDTEVDNFKFQIALYEGNYDIENLPNYEPYAEAITTNIYLNEPLRKKNNVVDYVDFENNKVIRNIREYVFTGTENFSGGAWYSGYYKWYTSVEPVHKINTINALCTHYTYDNHYNGFYASSFYFGGSCNFGSELATADEFKEYLAELYSNGNPVKVYYELKTPTEETVELPNIPTIKGTTIIEVDTTIQPSNLEVVYKGKK